MEPIDIFELNCLFDRAAALTMAILVDLDNFLPEKLSFCFLSNFLRLLFRWSFVADFIAAQIDSFLFIYLSSEYHQKVTSDTALKIVHANKASVLILGKDYENSNKCNRILKWGEKLRKMIFS